MHGSISNLNLEASRNCRLGRGLAPHIPLEIRGNGRSTGWERIVLCLLGDITAGKGMHDNAYTVIGSVIFGWLVLLCLLVVSYLAWLEVAERRRERRREEKRAQMDRENPYRPTTSRRLAFQ